MSDTAAPPTDGAPADGQPAELAPSGDGSFADLMDALVKDEGGEEAPAVPGEGGAGGAGAAAPDPGAAGGDGGGAGGQPADAAAAGTAAAQPPAAGAPGTPGDAGAPGGDPEQPAAGSAGGDLPDGWTASAAEFVPKLGELSTALEERTAETYKQQALASVREEHAQYFSALEQHPRLLVGQEVPAIGREGMERLKSTDDAREWQDAVKSILVAEVNDRAGRLSEESGDFLQNVHQSIEMFQNNLDLIPGTKDFDRELADQFAKVAQPYELRVDGKLQGYSIPVQPIIDHLRSVLTSTRAAAAPPAPSPAGGTPASPEQGGNQADPPQAGIPSKAGNGQSGEDFSTLFGTIGLPDLQI